MTHRVIFAAAMFLLAQPSAAQQAANPHGTLNLSCATCHAPDAWKPARVSDAFRHAPKTFPLEGAHTLTSCTGCHKRLDFKEVSSTCASCHEDVHKGELGADCVRCHTPRTFVEEPAMKQAHELTRFPLRGAHAILRCSSCHARSGSGQLQFVGRGATCQTCHATDAQAVAQPDHKTAGFSDCAWCHSSSTWRNARFAHNTTRFPLTGAHNAVACTGCHGDLVYRGKSIECASCHQADAQAAKNPPHASSAFTAPCTTCHTTTAWTGASFNHNATQFPLAGAHRATPCMGCHADGVFAGKPMTCASCHQADYNQTTNPNHATASFPTACANCHTTTTWLGATFDHDSRYFPIYSGKHRGQWSTCATCHTSPTNYQVFTCLTCHEHNQTSMNDKHKSRSGYRYDSQTCYSCHPRGTEP